MKKFETADWSFYPSTQEIEYPGGDKVALPTRLSNCLECLINARGDVVDYDTLLLSVWKTTHREASTISSVISELRRTIQCSKTGTTYIKNVPKKGYRFVGDYVEKEITLPDSVYVEPIKEPAPIKESASTKEAAPSEQADADVESVPEPATESKPPAEQEHVTQPDSRRTEQTSPQKLEEENVPGSGSKLMVAVIILLLIGSFAIWEWLAEDDTSLEPTINKTADKDAATSTQMPMYSGIEILTHESGQSASFDVSPDLNWLVYSHKPDGAETRRLIAKNLTTGERVEIPFSKGEEYWSPRFSNDGKKLVYVRSTETSCAIETIDFLDQKFSSDSIRVAASCGNSPIFTTPTFSKDDTFIYFSASSGLNDPLKTYRVDLLQGSLQQLTAPTQKGRGDYAMTMSPDGSYLAIVRDEYWGQSVVVLYDLRNDNFVRLLELPYVAFQVAWLDNEHLVYMGANHEFISYSIKSGASDAITGDMLQNVIYPVIRNQNLYAYQGRMYQYEVWSLDLEKLTFTPEIKSRFNDLYAVDTGDVTFFVSDRSGSSQIWKKSDTTFHKITNSTSAKPVTEPHYSKITNKLYYASQNEIVHINTETGLEKVVFAHDKIIQNASISDDGELMTFTVQENNRYYIESLNLQTLHVTRLENGFMGRIADGKLFFTRIPQGPLLVRELNETNEKILVERFPPASVRMWSVLNGNIVYFSQNITNQSKVINVLRLNTGNIDTVKLEKSVTSMSCIEGYHSCLMTVRLSGDTSIIGFKKNKDF